MSGIISSISQRLQILSPDDVNNVHEASIRILSDVGVVFQSEEACAILQSHGAKRAGKTIRFPRKMVESALEASPEKLTLYARNPDRNVYLGEGKIHYTSCFGPVLVRGLGEKQALPATLDDLRRFTLLDDAMGNVSYCLFHVRPHEVPAGLHDVFCAATMLKITDKHIHFSQDDERNTETLIELGEAAGQGSEAEGPVFSLGCCPTTPLVYQEDSCRKLLAAVPKGIPFLVVSGAMAGGTSPATLAGTLAVQNAETVAGIVLAQSIKPGAPVVYGSFSGGMDMRSGGFVMGGTELALMQAATAQLCRLYRIPFGYGSGGWTDACEPNIQAGIEKATTMLTAALAGVEVLHSAHGGMICGAQVADYAQMMIDDELCSMVNRYLGGITVSEETLAFDLIKERGPGGNFLDTDHTSRSFRSEHFLPKLFSRFSYGEGDRSIIEDATEKAKKLLETHIPNSLPVEVAVRIDKIVSKSIEK